MKSPLLNCILLCANPINEIVSNLPKIDANFQDKNLDFWKESFLCLFKEVNIEDFL